ncbi:serine/threonine protein kinase [Nocardiopsis sp. HNM0947]|uniref:Serine/threonine protein kinase n=1 Tax=Nocardiopsis coralli TaxID=2772213 RepID=A0ABR9P617_9ACTN|nr:serine/threonine-protein kinase [Nocardiopsis coralli]MBE2999283.1 serine/threonine protein kinase [Nocardiopsis coralli]
MNQQTAVPFDRKHVPADLKPLGEGDPEGLGPYRVLGRIGAGGMGAVYAGLGEDGTCAAVKVVHPQFAADDEFRSRFAREVDLVSRVRASCTPAFLGTDLGSETPWLATDYVPGLTLRAHVSRNGPLTGGMLTAFATGMAEALVAIHGTGVVHRDLKPGNVILSPDGPKVLDFGIARATDGTALTSTGGLLGTPGWMAPELYEGDGATPASDMFAWAAMVAYAATGREPFGRGPIEAVSHRTQTEEPDLTGVSGDVEQLVRYGLSKDPARRPTAEQALTELTDRWRHTRVRPGPVPDAPTEVVPALLAQEWDGVEAPPVKRVRGRGRAWALGVTGVVAAGTAVGLLAVWLFADTGPGGDEDAAADHAEEGAEGSGEAEEPQVARDPEEAAGVFEEAAETARGASSFIVASHRYSNQPGDSTPYFYWYTEDPERAFLSLSMLGPTGGGHLAYGPDLEEIVGVSERNDYITGEEERTYGQAGDEDAVDNPLHEWEYELAGLEALAADGSELSYEGTEEVPEVMVSLEEMPGQSPDGEELAGREGHRYTGTAAGGFWLHPGSDEEPGDRTADVDLWVSEAGYPLALRVEETVEGEQSEGGGALTYSHDLDFMVFDAPVDIEIPDESQIEGGADPGTD